MFRTKLNILFLIISFFLNIKSLEITPDQTKLDKMTFRKAHESLLATLLKTPVNFLKINREQRTNFLNSIKEKFENSTEENLDFELQFPLFSIDECNEKNCNNKRDGEHSYIRTACETEIINEIKNAALQKKDAVNYVNFGSGDCFQDLLIVTQLLEQGIENINLHLIDPVYDFYIESIKKAYSPKNINEYIHLKHSPFKQLARWFSVMYPRSNCKIFIYKNLKSYKKFIKNNSHLKADVVFGIDFTKEYPTGLYMYNDFLSLLEYVFLNNDKAVGFKDFGFCVLKFSVDEDLKENFEILLMTKEKKLEEIALHPEEYEEEEPWVKLLFNKTFCTTGKIIKYMPIPDKCFKAQYEYWMTKGFQN